MTVATVEGCAFFLAVVAAMRSTWSPCGISMLSTLTPLGERSRGHRYAATVGWFVAGALAGGAGLGAIMAALAAGVRAWSPSAGAVTIVVVAAGVVALASDLRPAGWHLPTIPRQVNEVWTGRYRSWVYAAGFGAQIGVGVSTYVMTAAVYLVIVLAAMTASPAVGLLVGLSFGLVRGLAILLGIGLRTPEAIRRFHRRFDAAGRASLVVAMIAQADVLIVAIAPAVTPELVIGNAILDAIVVAFMLGARAVRLRRRGATSHPQVARVV
jgi:sulfite exporter TauE/SafE